MTTQESFKQAIAEDPADITRQLVYSDWLEENGQGEEAEKLRLKILNDAGFQLMQTLNKTLSATGVQEVREGSSERNYDSSRRHSFKMGDTEYALASGYSVGDRRIGWDWATLSATKGQDVETVGMSIGGVYITRNDAVVLSTTDEGFPGQAATPILVERLNELQNILTQWMEQRSQTVGARVTAAAGGVLSLLKRALGL